MKRGLPLLLVLLLILVGCQQKDDSVDMTGILRPPTINELPIQGIWTIRSIEGDAHAENPSRYKVGQELVIDQKLVAIGEEISTTPNFSSKFVNVKDYTELRLIGQKLPMQESQSVRVDMIRDNDLFSMDLLTLSDGRLAFSTDSRLYVLERTNEVVPERTKVAFLERAQEQQRQNRKIADKTNIATLIGVRTPSRTDDGYPYFRYDSYLIVDEPERARPSVYRTEGLFFLNADHVSSKMTYQMTEPDPTNLIMKGTYSIRTLADVEGRNARILYDALGRGITFIGGDIVSFDKPNTYPPAASSLKRYELHRLSEFGAQHVLSVRDLAGKTEESAFKEQVSAQLAIIDPNRKVDPSRFPLDTENIGIVRRNVSWGFVTSMVWRAGDKTFPTRVNLDIVPTTPVFNIPSQPFSWTRITNKVPLARTASASPAQDRSLIQDEDEIMYFRSTASTIDAQALLSIQTESNAQIVNIDYYYNDQEKEVKDSFLGQEMEQPQVIFSRARENAPTDAAMSDGKE